MIHTGNFNSSYAYSGEEDMTDKEPEPNEGNPAEAAGITKRKRDRNLYKIVPVRLPRDKWDRFGKEADDLGTGSSTLARI